MLFNSAPFFLFFLAVAVGYFALPHRFRWMLLLAASCFFYTTFVPIYLAVIFATIVVDYVAAIQIEKASGKTRKAWLWASIFTTCAILFVFKYFNFFNANFEWAAQQLGLHYPKMVLSLLLPIGLSFHTFQSLSYIIEVYWGKQKAERHFGIYALYVMFFPQLVAGPIERPQNLLHQFREHKLFNYNETTDGLKLMAWGLFKKVVIADRLSFLVNNVYAGYNTYTGLTLLCGVFAFHLQLYFDFSGYSDMARGMAQVLGFRLMENFKSPFFATSISDFWKRWHISLSTWFRDYVYFPLGGSRVKEWRVYANIMVVFLMSGLWHGASWTYVVWGGLNGLFLVGERATASLRAKVSLRTGLIHFPKLSTFIAIISTTLLICFTRVFYRSDSFMSGLAYLKKIGTTFSLSLPSFNELISVAGSRNFMIFTVGIGIVLLVDYFQRNGSFLTHLNRQPVYTRWAIYYMVVIAIFILGVWDENAFIYFRF